MCVLVEAALIFTQRNAFQNTKEEFGGIDIVCNNAGVVNEGNWRTMVDINLVCYAIFP